MNFSIKKASMIATLLLVCPQLMANKEVEKIVLTSPLLRVADNAGVFHGPIIDILQTRIDFVNLVQGVKVWNGAVIDASILDSNHHLTIYCRRPEIMCGASFIAILPDHELAPTIATAQHAAAVDRFIATKTNLSLFDRQMSATNEGIFTGAYGINPFTQELLPIYVSDYAIESFDSRHSKARLGIPAHNSKDLEFAKLYNLPIKLVVDVARNAQGEKEDIAAPLLDKHNNLTEAYLGEYHGCIIVNNDILHNAPLKDAAKFVIDYLEKNNKGKAHSQTIEYNYNNSTYSVKDLVKIESALYKNGPENSQTIALKKELQIALNYAQADFLEIGEKFLINLKNTKTLMVALIEESCALRTNDQCYLLRWAHMKNDVNEKEIFRRDIKTIKDFKKFCKDLVDFLGDFANSCPRAKEALIARQPKNAHK